MDFSTLFTGLPAGDVPGRCGPAAPDSKSSACEQSTKRTCARKRRISEEPKTKHKQKNTKIQKAKASSIHPSKPRDYCMVNHEYGQTSVNFTKDLDLCSYDGNVDQNMDQKAQHHKTKNNQKQHWKRNRWGPSNRTGCHQANHKRGASIKGRGSRNRGRAFQGGALPGKADRSKNAPVERKKFMTQEFKDQNSLEVNGRSICRHFLWGRCIKGDGCQLDHIQGYNNIIKEVCKFYVQGFCTKGESCPYMHDSFPCKFFHTRGKCSHGPECKFSHAPLTDLTKELLDKVLKMDNELGLQNHDSGEPENTEKNMTPNETKSDIYLHPIMPNFYNSLCPTKPHDKMETLRQTTGMTNVTEDVASPPCITAPVLSPNLLSHPPSCKELVSYSVEAVLGAQKSTNLPSPFAMPRGQDSGICSSPKTIGDCTPSSAHLKEAPYSGGRVAPMNRPFSRIFATPIADDPQQQFPSQTMPELAQTTPNLREFTPTDGFSTASFGKTTAIEYHETAERPSLCLSASHVTKTTPLTPVKDEPILSVQPADCTSYVQQGTQSSSTSKSSFRDLFAGLGNNLIQTLNPPKSPDTLPRCKRNMSPTLNLAVHIKKSPNQVAKTTCSNLPDSFSETPNSVYSNVHLESSRSQAQQELQDGSSQNASSSNFKTLFLQLSPYCQAGEKEGQTWSQFSLGNKNGEQKSSRSISTEQLMREEKGQKEKMKEVESKKSSHLRSTVKSVEPLNPFTRTSLKAEVGSTSTSIRVSHIPVRSPGMHSLPVKPVAAKAQPQTRMALEQHFRKKGQRTGTTDGTGLKKLFMTLDPTASPFGQ